jgi:hypothetical protein
VATTHGFELVAEVTQDFLLKVAQAAWDSSLIPHSIDVAPGLAFGPYQVADGVVNIPRAGLGVEMVPAQNAVRLKLPSEIQVHIADPPIPSATMFNLTADVFAALPVGTLPETINVGLITDGLPRANISVTLTSGDPIGPITLSSIQEYVHARYEDGTIPHTITQNGVSFSIYTADAYVEVFDDPTDPAHQITVTQPSPGQVALSIPIHLKLTNLHSAGDIQPLSPIGVETRIEVTAPLVTAPGSITAQFLPGTITVENLTPAAGVEGTNYTADKAGAQTFGIDLDALLKTQIQAHAQTIVNAIGNVQVFVPTQGQVETFIGDQVHQALLDRGNIGVWTPQTEGSDVTVNDVTPKVLSDALAIGINAGVGADANALTNFIPAAREFAIAIDGAKVLAVIDQTIHRPEDEGGFGPDFPPKTFHNVNGHDARVDSLSITLTEGSIHVEGDVTVIDAIAGHIDVGADFEAEIGLNWVDNADGTQIIDPVTLDTDVDLSLLAWIVSFLLGFLFFGVIGAIVAIVVLIVVEDVAEKVGGAIIRDDVSDQVKGIGAWPQTLEGIGTVSAKFQNPIDIHSDCVIFSG